MLSATIIMHSIVEGTTQCRAQQENLLLSWGFVKISMQPFFETQEQGVIYPRITSNIAIAFCCHNHAIFCLRENPVQGSTGKSSAEWEIYPDLHAAFLWNSGAGCHSNNPSFKVFWHHHVCAAKKINCKQTWGVYPEKEDYPYTHWWYPTPIHNQDNLPKVPHHIMSKDWQ